MTGEQVSGLLQHRPEALEKIIHVLYTFEITAFFTILIGLFRPVKFAFGDDNQGRQIMANLIEQFGTSSEDYLKLFPHDKSYYVNSRASAALAYGVIGGSTIILGGPVGDASDKQELIVDFVEFCRVNGWRVAAINLDKDDLKMYTASGLANKLFIGSEAIVDAKLFHEKTIRSKHFRYITNRARKQGLEFDWWTRPNDKQIDSLQSVSKSWASAKGRRDYRFFMGPFDRDYMRDCQIGVVKQHGKVVAYANLLPHNKHVQTSSIDHMRAIQGADMATMHFLLSQIILHEHTAGQKYFTLGLSPLESGPKDTEQMTALLRYARRVGSRFYAFGGLKQFKNKFEPEWQPQYIAFNGSASQYLSVLNDITTIGSTNPRLRSQYRIVVVILVLAIASVYVALP